MTLNEVVTYLLILIHNIELSGLIFITFGVKKKNRIWILFTIFLTQYILALVKLRLTHTSNIIQYLMILIMLALLVVYTLMLNGKTHVKLLFAFIVIIMENIADYLTYIIGICIMGVSNYWGNMWFFQIIFFVFSTVLWYIVYRVWNRKLKVPLMTDRLKGSRGWIGCYSLVVVFIWTQILLIWFLSSEIFVTYQFGIFELAGMFLETAANILLLYVMSDTLQGIEKEQEIVKVQIQQEKETRRYENLMANIEKTAKLRHDYQNYLETIYYLLENQNEDGLDLLRNLKQEVYAHNEAAAADSPDADI